MRICTGQVKHQSGLAALFQLLQSSVQLRQIVVVAATVGQFNVYVAAFFAERKILCAVHGQGEHAVIDLKNMRCAVALVHIQVNHRHLQSFSLMTRGFGLQQTRRHRHVVEHTKTATLVGVSMVGATGQIGRYTFFHGCAGRADGGPDRTTGPLHHARRPRKTDLALCFIAQTALRHRIYVRRRVHQGQFAVAGGLGQLQLQLR